MPVLKRILCPTDFSTCSHAALDMAAFIAAKLDGRIDVLHVVEFPLFVRPELIVEEEGGTSRPLQSIVEEQLRVEMRGLLRKLDEATRGRVTPHIITNHASEGIVAFATSHGSDLIVIGTHGRTGLSHALMGSVAERTVRRAPCPVLTVRASGADPSSTGSAP